MAVIKQTPAITFPADQVQKAKVLLPTCKMDEAVKALLGSDIESCSDYHSTVVGGILCRAPGQKRNGS